MLRDLLAASFTFGECTTVNAHRNAKCLGMFGAGFRNHTIFRRAKAATLKPLLQSRFMIRLGKQLSDGRRVVQQRAVDKCSGSVKASVAKNGADDGFIGVCKQILLLAASRFLFSRAKAQVLAQIQTIGRFFGAADTDETRAGFGEATLVPIEELGDENAADRQTQDTIAQEFEALVVRSAGIECVRTMSKRPFEPLDILEPVTKGSFERFSFGIVHTAAR
ncbi:MAG: hypothetical protein WAN10_15010 [Candidatus Acidiferrales bacterium]